jgi:hypothetical protein
MRLRISTLAVLFLVAPAVARASNPATPQQTYPAHVRRPVSPYPAVAGGFKYKVGYLSGSNAGQGRIQLKFKDAVAPLPPTDQVPCSGDEPICVVPFTDFSPGNPLLLGQVVLRPESLGGGFIYFFAYDAAFFVPAGHWIFFGPGACYPNVSFAPALSKIAASPNSCMGIEYAPVTTPSAPALYYIFN